MNLFRLHLIGLMFFFSNIIIPSENPTHVIVCSESDFPALMKKIVNDFSQFDSTMTTPVTQKSNALTMAKKTTIPTVTTSAAIETFSQSSNESCFITVEHRQAFANMAKKRRRNWRDNNHYQPLLGVTVQEDPSYNQAKSEFKEEAKHRNPSFYFAQMGYKIEQRTKQNQEFKEEMAKKYALIAEIEKATYTTASVEHSLNSIKSNMGYASNNKKKHIDQ